LVHIVHTILAPSLSHRPSTFSHPTDRAMSITGRVPNRSGLQAKGKLSKKSRCRQLVDTLFDLGVSGETVNANAFDKILDLLPRSKDYSPQLNLFLFLVQCKLCRLAAQLANTTDDTTIESLTRFLETSQSKRLITAHSTTIQLMDCLDGMLYPSKTALLFAAGLKPTRFFRDLDFYCEIDTFDKALSKLRLLKFYPGDLDPADWDRYLVTSTRSSKLIRAQEVHFFRVSYVGDEDFEADFTYASKFLQRAPELQFYSRLQRRLINREFVDITFDTISSMPKAVSHITTPPKVAYLSQLLFDICNDVKIKRRVSLHHLVEVANIVKHDSDRSIAKIRILPGVNSIFTFQRNRVGLTVEAHEAATAFVESRCHYS
jgi:hypothetical protein